MHTPAPIVSSEMAFANFDLVSFGEIDVPAHPLRFGFQIDIVPGADSPQQVLIGLVARTVGEKGRKQTHGFAVKVDLGTGEIWDLLNGSGLVGWVTGLPDSYTDEAPMLLSWQVEHLGSALIPKLQIGHEVFLYPAIHFQKGMIMDTIAGGDGIRKLASSPFLHPALWRESLISTH